MSGFAHSTGEADGLPIFPPLALADNISAPRRDDRDPHALHARA
ncbi:MAG: hypothetical protein U0R76_08900 [Candidatus Nanopelagicales bacterium]